MAVLWWLDNSISLVCFMHDTWMSHSYQFLFAVNGFCSYDSFTSPDDRGTYNWTETAVTSPPTIRELDCFYEPQNIKEGGIATRACLFNNTWRNPNDTTRPYNGSQCITESTFQLRMLSRVGFKELILCKISITYASDLLMILSFAATCYS